MNNISSRSICIGHLNVYHVYNKCTEVSLLVQKLGPAHLFGISECRLDARFTDNLISINDYTVLRRDSDYYWLDWCQYTVTGWNITFGLQLLSRSGSMCIV